MATLLMAGFAFAAGLAAARIALSVIHFAFGLAGLVVLVTAASFLAGEAPSGIAVRAIAVTIAPQIGYAAGLVTLTFARTPRARAAERARMAGSRGGASAAGRRERAGVQDRKVASGRSD
jgi:hypothetical protein